MHRVKWPSTSAMLAVGMVGALAAPVALAGPLEQKLTPQANAELRDGAGSLVGQATFFEDRSGVRVRVEVRGLTPGQHGVHLHAVGRCEGPDFMSAGGHFNPTDRQHGLQNLSGPHGGDFPDLVAVADGVSIYETTTARVTLQAGRANSLFGTDGTALVIHADPDDQVTDPAGNSGGRVVCGVIRR